MFERFTEIRSRFAAAPGLEAAYQAAVRRIDADGRLADHRASILPDPMIATVADYQRLTVAPVKDLLRMTRR